MSFALRIVARNQSYDKELVRNLKPSETLPEVAAFIRQIRADLKPAASPSSDDAVWFSRRGGGFLALSREETRAYSAIIARLMQKFVPNEDLSRRSVETFLQDAMFTALDLQSRSQETFDVRLRSALGRLLTLLKAPCQTFTCWIPIEGVAIDAVAKFAGVRFARFGSAAAPRYGSSRTRSCAAARGLEDQHGQPAGGRRLQAAVCGPRD